MRLARKTGRILYVSILRIRDASHRASESLGSWMKRKCRVHIEAGYIAGSLHCLRYMSALEHLRGNFQFQSEGSIAFSLHPIFFVERYVKWVHFMIAV